MNYAKPWDGKVTLNNKSGKWDVHKMIEYPINGLCMRDKIATGFHTRKEAADWIGRYADLKLI